MSQSFLTLVSYIRLPSIVERLRSMSSRFDASSPEAISLLTPKFFYKTRLKMSKEEVKGRSKKIKGQIREEVGKLTDNKTEQLKGKIEQVEGKVQEELGKAKRKG